jgi:hypothetical protein
MNNEEMDRVLNRLRKMLAMANDKANIHESAVAAAMAEKLMRKYQIEMADVLAGDEGFTARDVNEEFEWCGNGDDAWKGWIAIGVAKLNECEVTFRGHKISKGYLFIGIGPDPAVAAEMFKYLTRETSRLCKMAKLPNRGAMNSFMKGCGSELADRLKELREQRQAEFQASAGGKALVIHKQALMEAAGWKVTYRTGGKMHTSDWSAFNSGRAAGAGINLNDQITNGGSNGPRLE